MQGERWTIFAKNRREVFLVTLGSKLYRFLEQRHMQMMSLQLQSQPSVWFLHDLCSFSSKRLCRSDGGTGKNYTKYYILKWKCEGFETRLLFIICTLDSTF